MAAVRPGVLLPALVHAVVQLALRASAPQVGRPHRTGRRGHVAGNFDHVAVGEALASAQHPGVQTVPVTAADTAPLVVDAHLHSARVGSVDSAYQTVRDAWIGGSKRWLTATCME